MIVSIFVNPTQFGPTEDLASYPRTLDADLAKCRAGGRRRRLRAGTPRSCTPTARRPASRCAELAKPLCGASRPHFFGGVATVVTKLLVAARPHVAVFGEKDYQQLQVVRRLARDLLLDVEIVGAPIVREADGLAMSSRNVYLDPRAAQRSARAGARARCGGGRGGERRTLGRRAARDACARRSVARRTRRSTTPSCAIPRRSPNSPASRSRAARAGRPLSDDHAP